MSEIGESVLESFINRIPSFDDLSRGEVTLYFVYFLTVEVGQNAAQAAEIRSLFRKARIRDFVRLSTFLSEQSSGKNPSLIRVAKGYRLERKIEEKFKKSLTSENGYGELARETNTKLRDLIDQIGDQSVKAFLAEAVSCYEIKAYRAAIVLGWCAVIDHLQAKVQAIGFQKFNQASVRVKNQTSGKFKNWNKDFKITTISELQSVFDTDLLLVLEGGLGLIDSNEGQRLEILFKYRNQSAHPGNAPISEPHLIAFFSDIIDIVLANPNLKP